MEKIKPREMIEKELKAVYITLNNIVTIFTDVQRVKSVEHKHAEFYTRIRDLLGFRIIEEEQLIDKGGEKKHDAVGQPDRDNRKE